LEWLNWIPDESVQTCYIDPPFFSNANYEKIWGNGWEVASFKDRFAGGIEHYIAWIKERIILIHKKLKKTGVIFLHCDWHASHRLRVLLDEVFGEENFVNEIVTLEYKDSLNMPIHADWSAPLLQMSHEELVERIIAQKLLNIDTQKITYL
jgi:hypothetical protein